MGRHLQRNGEEPLDPQPFSKGQKQSTEQAFLFSGPVHADQSPTVLDELI